MMPHVCKVTTYLLDRAHREPVYNTVARHLRGVAPCGTGLIIWFWYWMFSNIGTF